MEVGSELDRGIIEHVGIRKPSVILVESNTDYVTGCCMIVKKVFMIIWVDLMNHFLCTMKM